MESFGKGYCSAAISSPKPVSHVSHSSAVVKSTGMALAMDRTDHVIGGRRQKRELLMLADFPFRPPVHKRHIDRHETVPFRLEPAAPIGRFQITHVPDRRHAEVWRRRKAPAYHAKLVFAVAGDANNRRHHVQVDGRKAGRLPAGSRAGGTR